MTDDAFQGQRGESRVPEAQLGDLLAQNGLRMLAAPAQVAALPCMANDTVFALHLPHGAELDLPDLEGPKGEKRYR